MKNAIMIITGSKARSHFNTVAVFDSIPGIEYKAKGRGIYVVISDDIDALLTCCYALGKKGIAISHIIQLV